MADGRNFRSLYYETLGLKSVEQKKALEVILKDDTLDLEKLSTFAFRFSVPAVYRLFVWKVLLGVLPQFQQTHGFVMKQRQEHFDDLKHALKIMKIIDENTPLPTVVSQMFLLEKGEMRFGTPSKLMSRKLAVIESICLILSELFDGDVDIYWLSVKFIMKQDQITCNMDKLPKIVGHYLQLEDSKLWQHLTDIQALQRLPLKRWFETYFAEDLPDTCLERIWDKIAAGSCRILVFVAISLLVVFRHFLFNARSSEAVEQFLQNIPKDSADVIESKAIELWDKYGNTSTPLDIPSVLH